MNRSRTRLLAIIVLSCVGLIAAGALGAWRIRPRPNLTYKTVECVRPGMPLSEVRDLIRVAPGDYSERASNDGIVGKIQRELDRPLQHVWFDDDLFLAVWTDDAGQVTASRHFRYRYRGPTSLYERARRWCGLSPSLDPDR